MIFGSWVGSKDPIILRFYIRSGSKRSNRKIWIASNGQYFQPHNFEYYSISFPYTSASGISSKSSERLTKQFNENAKIN